MATLDLATRSGVHIVCWQAGGIQSYLAAFGLLVFAAYLLQTIQLACCFMESTDADAGSRVEIDNQIIEN